MPLQTAAVLATAALAGGALGFWLAGPGTPTPPAPASKRVVAVGDVRVSVPVGWSVVKERPPRGLDVRGARRFRGAFSDVVIAQARAGGPSLLPAALVRGMDVLPRPAPIMGGRAWSYAIALPGRPARQAEVEAVPTTGGVVVVACVAPAGTLSAGDCATALQAIRLARGHALRPGPDAAFLSALPQVVAGLSVARRAARDQLAGATTPAMRAGAARSLAAAYDGAARDLRPLAATAPGAGATLALLDRLRSDHAALAGATAIPDPAGAATATARIRAGEDALAGQLAGWQRRMASG